MAKCEYEGCNNQILADGLCSLHLPPEKRKVAKFSEEIFKKDFSAFVYNVFSIEFDRTNESSNKDFFHNSLSGDDFYCSLFGDFDAVAAQVRALSLSGSVCFDGVFFSGLSKDLSCELMGAVRKICGTNSSSKVSFKKCSFAVFVPLVNDSSRSFSFDCCSFDYVSLELSSKLTRFFDCCFDGATEISFLLDISKEEKRLEIFDGNCKFKGDLKVSASQKPRSNDFTQYCLPCSSIFSKLTLHGFKFPDGFSVSDILSLFESRRGISISFNDCVFDCRFEINKDSDIFYEITEKSINDSGFFLDNVELNDCVFRDKFEFKGNAIKSLNISNSKFKEVADFFGTKTESMSMRRVDFERFFAFEEAEVSTGLAEFRYVTLHNHATFRDTKFLGGLSLDRANFSGEANFLGVDADGGNIKKTTRETYRLIKHSFDKIGNHLEANKFFAKEMDKYREEVSGNKTLPLWDRAVYHINKNVSDFGQNYLLSIGWLLLAMVFYFYVFVFHRHMGWLHTESSCNVFGNTYDKLNCLASGMIPFKGFLTNGMELLSLIFYIIFAVLVWQTVVALKRHTRR